LTIQSQALALTHPAIFCVYNRSDINIKWFC
jgi:hypothetical protein